MATTISQRELRNDSAEIMRRVEGGEMFVVTRNGTPIADLAPHRPVGRRRFVPVDELAAALADLGPWGVDDFAREQDELDAVVDDEVSDPWSRRGSDG